MTHPALAGTQFHEGLTQEDMDAIKRTTSNLSDIPAASLARFEAGFRHAYDVAHLVTQGIKDPLSR